MRKLRRLFIALRLLLKHGDIILRPAVWTINDRAALNAFIASPTGKKWTLILDNEIIAHALEGDIPVTRGYQKAKALLNLLTISAAVPTDGNSRDGDRAQSPYEMGEGDASILERLSP